LAVTLLDSGELIGSCGIRRKLDDDWEADIGFELAPWHWGNGYATESARLLVEFGFQELKQHRISSWCIADNTASARVLERVGFRLVGRLRAGDYFKDRWWDTLLFALLEQEWAALRSGQ
jgi:RimJ/RimL family protein N-acetyltransferase